jgi:hypothetical protein
MAKKGGEGVRRAGFDECTFHLLTVVRRLAAGHTPLLCGLGIRHSGIRHSGIRHSGIRHSGTRHSGARDPDVLAVQTSWMCVSWGRRLNVSGSRRVSLQIVPDRTRPNSGTTGMIYLRAAFDVTMPSADQSDRETELRPARRMFPRWVSFVSQEDGCAK